MSEMRRLLHKFATHRSQLAASTNPSALASLRATFDQLHAESVEAGMDPVLFGALMCAAIVSLLMPPPADDA